MAYRPQTSGKAEAFIGILLREWAYARPCADNRARDPRSRRSSIATLTAVPTASSEG